MAKKKPPKRAIETLIGTVINLVAPNKDPGGGLGSTFIAFGLVGADKGRIYNGVFYIEVGKPRAEKNAATRPEPL